MSLTENEHLTKVRYDEKALEWLKFSGGKDRKHFWAENLIEMQGYLLPGSKILEIGCGPATDGTYLKNVGYRVLSFDYSKTMLGIAKELNPESLLLRMNMQNMAYAENSFDGFWASAALLHLENPKPTLGEIVRVTKNKGVGFISVKEGEGDGIDPKTGYYFRYYSQKEFVEILSVNGFDILSQKITTGTPAHSWLTYLVRVTK